MQDAYIFFNRFRRVELPAMPIISMYRLSTQPSRLQHTHEKTGFCLESIAYSEFVTKL
jgi:hypothetical protein